MTITVSVSDTNTFIHSIYLYIRFRLLYKQNMKENISIKGFKVEVTSSKILKSSLCWTVCLYRRREQPSSELIIILFFSPLIFWFLENFPVYTFVQPMVKVSAQIRIKLFHFVKNIWLKTVGYIKKKTFVGLKIKPSSFSSSVNFRFNLFKEYF